MTDDTQITHRYIKACFLLSSHRLRNLSLVSGPLVAVLNWAVTVATVEHDRLRKGNGSQLGSPSLSFVGFLLFFFFTFMHACKHAFMFIEVHKQLSGTGSSLLCAFWDFVQVVRWQAPSPDEPSCCP